MLPERSRLTPAEPQRPQAAGHVSWRVAIGAVVAVALVYAALGAAAFGAPLASALPAVLAFRLCAFWGPARGALAIAPSLRHDAAFAAGGRYGSPEGNGDDLVGVARDDREVPGAGAQTEGRRGDA